MDENGTWEIPQKWQNFPATRRQTKKGKSERENAWRRRKRESGIECKGADSINAVMMKL